MKKKGFTLIELLAVIVILSIIALIAIPIVLNVVNDAKESARKSSVAGFADAMKLGVSDYMFQNSGDLPAIDENFQKKYNSKGENVICEGVYSTDSYGIVLHNCKVGTNTTNYCFAKGNHYACDDTTYTSILEYAKNGVKPNISYQDQSGANIPELLDNMIPVKYEDNNSIYANTSQEWYDYNKKEWANAVVLKSGVTKTVGQTITEDDIALWYVWVPRYKYTIFNGNNENVPEQEIKVAFEKGIETTGTLSCVNQIYQVCTDTENGSIINGTSTYTHPAFTFGNKELTGIWVGKFENSTTDAACLSKANSLNCDKNSHIIEIKPNVDSLRFTSLSNFFSSIQNIKTNYKIDNGDSHLIKNLEWGAIAYLTQSKYGRCSDGTCEEVTINNARKNQIPFPIQTGCAANSVSERWSDTCQNEYHTIGGVKASTTGNIYGIYDMSGGAWEYVMGNSAETGSSLNLKVSGFVEIPEDKYFDLYPYSENVLSYKNGKLGDATKEILLSFSGTLGSGWNSDLSDFIYKYSPWFLRGDTAGDGRYAGIFSFIRSTGEPSDYYSSRSVLVLE